MMPSTLRLCVFVSRQSAISANILSTKDERRPWPRKTGGSRTFDTPSVETKPLVRFVACYLRQPRRARASRASSPAGQEVRTACGIPSALAATSIGPLEFGAATSTSCSDEGVISGWERSPYDLRPRKPGSRSANTRRVVIPADTASTLRDLQLLDSDTERFVFRAEASEEGIVLVGDNDDLDELMGYVAAEANHEANRRRKRRLDVAFEVLRTIDAPQGP